MGSYTFKWDLPAEEVYVTGTFDDWKKTVKLDKEGSAFSKTVELQPSAKIYYKYVVDGNWVLNETSPKEADHEGNTNNFLTPDDLLKSNPTAALISSVGPGATTTAMAAEQSATTPSDIPGGFPATPSNELEKPIGVNPLPAADGAVNPITLAPGEPVPDSIKAQDINQHVKLDKEAYEKSDALAGVDTTLPPVTKSTIPESSLPMGVSQTAAISTVGAGATTAALAGQVPKESKVPEVVKDSQDKAGAAPEASASTAGVTEKAAVEDELKEKVTPVPATSEGTAGVGTEKTENTGGIMAAAATTGGAIAAAAIATKDTVAEKAGPAVTDASAAVTDAANKNLPDSVKEKLPVSAQEAMAGSAKEGAREEVSPEVPAEVKESIAEAGKSPEAAGNTAAVEDKSKMESELLKEVKTIPAEGESKGKEVTPEDVKPAPEKAAEKAAEKPADRPATSTNGGDSTAAKKKNRLSAFVSKIKHKLSDN